MSKIRIHIEPGKITDTVSLEEKEVVHKLKNVLRLKKDDELYVFDGKGEEYLYKIKNIVKGKIYIEKVGRERKEDIPARRIALGFPLTKEEKIDFILQKATELGALSFIPFNCERCVHKAPSAKRLERWEKIIIEATRQSGRLWIPELHPVMEFKDIVGMSFQVKLAASIKGTGAKRVIDTQWGHVLIIVGPEGDLSESEESLLRENNFNFIKLSEHLLRVETAAVFAVGLINHLLAE
ncbi:MAG: 16S rRNA (uracil(1498)-N(3))-methyltransferase [Candidatus Omnitrophota bacterium]|nr:MAG: 16S rRNA (uracil(1498)-N(3))-methyltransferase [Candidatus Omnitrophota bacterium]